MGFDTFSTLNVMITCISTVGLAIGYHFLPRWLRWLFRKNDQINDSTNPISIEDVTGIVVTQTMPGASYHIDNIPQVKNMSKSGIIFIHMSTYLSILKNWDRASEFYGVRYDFDNDMWIRYCIGIKTYNYAPVTEVWDKLYSEIMFTPSEVRMCHQNSATISVHEVGDYPDYLKRAITEAKLVYTKDKLDPDGTHPYMYTNLNMSTSPIYIEARCTDETAAENISNRCLENALLVAESSLQTALRLEKDRLDTSGKTQSVESKNSSFLKLISQVRKVTEKKDSTLQDVTDLCDQLELMSKYPKDILIPPATYTGDIVSYHKWLKSQGVPVDELMDIDRSEPDQNNYN